MNFLSFFPCLSFLLVFKMLLPWLSGTFILAIHLLCLWSQLFHGLTIPISCDSPIYPQVLTCLCTSRTCIPACALDVCSWVFFFPQTLNFLFCIEVSINHLSHSAMSDSLWPYGLQHARLSCPSPAPKLAQTHVHQVSDIIHPSHPLLSPSPPAFNLSQHQGLFFTLGGQSIGVSASASDLPMNIQDWFPLEWTSLISLQFKGLSRVFSNTTVLGYSQLKIQVRCWISISNSTHLM